VGALKRAASKNQPHKKQKTGIMLLTEVWLGRDTALRRPRPAGRNECGKIGHFSVA
jgi:hypothetical protein